MGIDLVVVTQRSWLGEALTRGARDLDPPLTAVHNFGMDVPFLVESDTPAWWMPLEYAARIQYQGVNLPLLCPGPRWLPRVPPELLGRNVWLGRVSELDSCPFTAGFMKPAEAKIEALPAMWWGSISSFKAAALEAGLPPDAYVQVSDTHLDILGEYRCLVVDGEVTGVSCYLLNLDKETLIGDDQLDAHPKAQLAGACAFMKGAFAYLEGFSPRSMIVDVAQLHDGSWVILEANNTWSANPYGINPGVYVQGLLAAADYEGAQMRYHFIPDAWLSARAKRMLRPLPRRLS